MNFIIDCQDVFESLKGLSIQSCLRLFYNEDIIIDIPDEDKEQELDGNTFLFFSNGEIIGFYPSSENFTIQITKHKKEDIPKNSSNISNNKFWKSIIGEKILEVELLFNILEIPYGVRFEFNNKKSISLQYVSESEYDFDALIIRKNIDSAEPDDAGSVSELVI